MNTARDKAIHHELGHAVAAVLRGGWLEFVEVDEDGMGLTRWSPSGERDVRAFVAWAGPYVEHLWLLEHDEDYAECAETEPADAVRELLDGSDLEAYDAAVSELEQVAEALGLTPLSESWCRAWAYTLNDYYPVVQSLSARMGSGEVITHEVVAEAITKHEEDE